ncbi:EamA-like transporter family protein [Kordia sp. SMS9]|uniref:DMT family transporter n=1 Tax=Kordia sp. SMS9 TaxID=2282170 RepID=UPI000E0CD90E|nr:DMT family transporter [Kordia sp. SMS9]AXG71431.1 EamA-like transporter family protein [Kordia sp. SMS9]
MKSNKALLYGISIGILGIVLFSSKAVMVKLMYSYEVNALDALVLRMLFAFPIYLAIAYAYRNKEQPIVTTRKDYLWIFVFGFVGYYLASLFDFIGLTYIKASLERIILFLYPTIVLLLNRFFLKTKITSKQLLAISITYIGIIIAFGQEVQFSGTDTYIGGAFILLSAVTYASYLVGSGWLIPKFGVVKFTAYVMLVSCMCVFVHYGIVGSFDIFHFPWQVYLLGFLIACFATVIPSFLVSESIKRISSSNFAIIAAIGPISTIILAVLFLNEKLTLLQYFGSLIVILGIVLINLKKKKKD